VLLGRGAARNVPRYFTHAAYGLGSPLQERAAPFHPSSASIARSVQLPRFLG